MNKNLIYTTFKPQGNRHSYNSFIYEFLVSLRTLGKYDGEVIVFDYSGGDLLKEFGTTTKYGYLSIIPLDPVSNHIISNKRNIDTIPFLSKYEGYNIAHFDADIWFQRDINPMFKTIAETEGMYLAVEPKRSCNFRKGPEELLELYNKNNSVLGGFVFGGWCSGNQKAYLNFLNKAKSYWDQKKWDINIHGTDQSIYQVLVDFDKDNITGLEWCASHYLCEFSNGQWMLDGKPAGGIHLVGFGGARKDSIENLGPEYRFKTLHKEIFESWQTPQ
tara:strand:+ start:65 stop:886 length:822 start_codon:yes stop_codon:yes gene_type:complete